MAIFDAKSRYVLYSATASAIDWRGRTVTFVTPAEPPAAPELGRHRLSEKQRLDHLANHYLGDPYGFWRIAEANNALTVEAALDTALITIPAKV